jgi:hypothetical protein
MGSVGLAAIGCRRALSTPGRALALTSVVGLLTLACGGGTEKTRSTGGTPGVSTGGVVGDGGSTGTTGGTGSGTATGGTTSVGNGGTPSGTGGSSTGVGGSTSTGGTSAGGTSSSGGAPTGTGGTSATAGGGGAPACQMASYTFAPKIPTVYVMVDRSGSMFDCISTTNQVEPSCATPADTSWTKLKDATLMVIGSLQAQVRFGFASFTGTNPASGGTCPMIDQVDPALNNSTAIATVYNGLAFQPNTTEVGKKFETPARQALDMIGAKLLADASPGDKYIMFVTDGQPDYCDDANSLCAPDSVVAGLQILKTKGITTIVMGLQSALNDLPAGILQAFANAGAGEATVAPLRAASDTFAFYDQCNGIAGWHADLVSSGKTAERGVTLGTYAAAAGPTKPYTPNVADQTTLVNQLSAALSGVKSCTFDLSNVNGQAIKVDLNQLDMASISIMGTKVPLDMTNGWSMASPTQLVLSGMACDTWRMPNVNDIAFNFPCKTIIFE